MKNTKSISILIVFVSLIVLGLVGYLLNSKNKEIVPAVVYSNSDLGFTFSLPESWRGYSIVENTWEGNPLTATATKQTGTKLLIRNPKWTSTLPYEDIPVMVFTVEQWNSYVAGNFSVSAAPIEARELGRNRAYVFALPPRWNFDNSEGYEEAENIVKSNPLKTFDFKE